jgi:hypothetical protein
MIAHRAETWTPGEQFMHLKLTGPRVAKNEQVLARLGFSYRDDSTYHCEDPSDASSRLVRAQQAGEIEWDELELLWPVFSALERANASHLMVLAYPKFGYPQPENSYRKQLYSQRTCSKCVAAFSQVGSLKLKSMPKKAKLLAFTLHWEFQLLLSIDAYDALTVGCNEAFKRPVYCGKETSSEIVQLDSKARVDLQVTGRDVRECCEECGVKIYHSNPRSEFYAPVPSPSASICLSRQFCGPSGNLWVYPMIVDQAFYQRALAANVRGLLWHPCRSSC